MSFFRAKKRCEMAKATYRQKIDGKVFNVGDDLPELGSFKFTDKGYGQIASLSGNSADISKLPTDVKQESSAYVIDTGELYMFDETNEQWVKQ